MKFRFFSLLVLLDGVRGLRGGVRFLMTREDIFFFSEKSKRKKEKGEDLFFLSFCLPLIVSLNIVSQIFFGSFSLFIAFRLEGVYRSSFCI